MEPSQIVSGGSLVFGGVFAVIGLLGLFPLFFVIVVVANRAEPDPRGLRPSSVYLFGMSFVTLMFGYGGAVMIVTALLSFIGPHNSPIANAVASDVVIGALFAAIAGGTFAVHVRKGITIARGDGRVDGPNNRILHTYVSVVSFVFVAVAIVTLGLAVFLLFQEIGPGIFGSLGGSRTGTLRDLIDVVYVMVASGVIVMAHSRLLPEGFLFRSSPPAVAAPMPKQI
jgi:hypothetical protein